MILKFKKKNYLYAIREKYYLKKIINILLIKLIY